MNRQNQTNNNSNNLFNQQLSQMTSSPLFKRAQQMANGKTETELEQTARNICSQKGIDLDGALRTFKQMFGNK